MNMFEAFSHCMRNYFTFSGRGSMREFWWFQLILFLISCLATEQAVPAMGIVFIIPVLAAGSRRLHDTGRSGWWQLLLLIPVVGIIVLIIFYAQEPIKAANKFGPSLGTDGYPVQDEDLVPVDAPAGEGEDQT